MSNELQLARHFESYRQDTLAFLSSRVGSADLADDLLQQTFLRLLQRADWARVENPKAYIKTTARNVLADYFKLQSVRFSAADIEFSEERHSDETWGPGRLLQSHQKLELLVGSLRTLSTSVRRAFVLVRFFGYTHAEAGEMLGLSPRTVQKHVAKGLATCFQAVDDGERRVNGATYASEESV